jgi:hypothetical protein
MMVMVKLLRMEIKLNKQLWQLGLIVLLGILLGACGGSTEPPPLETILTALDINWDTSNIDALVGQTITITLVNEGALDHNFKIAELGIDIDIAAGATEVTTFVVPQAGIIDFTCNVPGHLEAGMVGTITVSQ